MKKILLVSATERNNLKLIQNIERLVKEKGHNTQIVILESLSLPLYTPLEEEKNGMPPQALELADQFIEADAIVIAAPEYNGGTPPVLVNAIAWISRCDSKDWRKSLNEKHFVLATHSSSMGQKMLLELRIRLDHFGAIVLPRIISVKGKAEFDEAKAKSALDVLYRQM